MFGDKNKLQKEVAKLIVKNLNEEEIYNLKHLFESLDTEGKGLISIASLISQLSNQNLDIPQSAIQKA